MYIVRKETENQVSKYLLKLDRGAGKLEIYRKADNSILNEHYSIRPDFDSSDYMMYEKMKSMDCIFGGEKSPTPGGIFKIEKKSPKEYISGYYPDRKNVKFFGYIRRDVFVYHNKSWTG